MIKWTFLERIKMKCRNCKYWDLGKINSVCEGCGIGYNKFEAREKKIYSDSDIDKFIADSREKITSLDNIEQPDDCYTECNNLLVDLVTKSDEANVIIEQLKKHKKELEQQIELIKELEKALVITGRA